MQPLWLHLKVSFQTGISVLISKSAVTDTAIELAKDFHLTLMRFVRDGKMNIYNIKYILLGITFPAKKKFLRSKNLGECYKARTFYAVLYVRSLFVFHCFIHYFIIVSCIIYI